MATSPHYTNIKKKLKKAVPSKKQLKRLGKSVFWFTFGGILGLFFFLSFIYFYYQQTHKDKVYQGVIINGTDFGGKSQDEVQTFFAEKNKRLNDMAITLHSEQTVATVSAHQIDFGYDAELLAHQAMSIGRSADSTVSNMSLIAQAYMQNITLPPAYTYEEEKLNAMIKPLKTKMDIKAVDPLFNFENGKVVTFRLGKDGRSVDEEALKQDIIHHLRAGLRQENPQSLTIPIPVVTVPSAVAEEKASDLGIKEKVAEGTSLYTGSIENRAYNIALAANRLNGVIIKPDEVFSFNKAVGEISTVSGYRQAYVISGGKTVLGDGGGVCQVSTTLFRAALNAGLPIVERNPHAYRVSYYEQDRGPGIDAAIYSPGVDLKFKNTTGHHLLIQTYLDLNQQRLTFAFYGTDDGREVAVSEPVILSQTPAPEPKYEDDPNLPKDEIKQIDFAAPGASVYFTRTVKKDGKVIIDDKFSSNYRPWQAVYLKGTKE